MLIIRFNSPIWRRTCKQALVFQSVTRNYVEGNEDYSTPDEEIVKLNKQAMKGVAKPIIDKKALKKELEEDIPEFDLRYEYNRTHAEEAVDKATGINSTENRRIKMELKYTEEREEYISK